MDFSKMTIDELVQLQGKIGTEIQMRKDNEFNEAVKQLKTAYFNIKDKFPCASWDIMTYDEYDNYDYTIDLMEMGSSLFDHICC